MPLVRLIAAALTVGSQVAAQPLATVPSNTVAGITVTVSRAHEVSGITVSALEPCTTPAPKGMRAPTPHVVSTFPERDSVVKPGLLFLRVTFSERMSRCSFQLMMPQANMTILPIKSQLSPDRKTFLFAINTDPNRRYAFRFGSDGSYRVPSNFKSMYGVAAEDYPIHFTTSSDPATSDVVTALAEDHGLEGVLTGRGYFIKLWVPRSRNNGNPICGNCSGDLRTIATGGGTIDLLLRDKSTAPDASSADNSEPGPTN